MFNYLTSICTCSWNIYITTLKILHIYENFFHELFFLYFLYFLYFLFFLCFFVFKLLSKSYIYMKTFFFMGLFFLFFLPFKNQRMNRLLCHVVCSHGHFQFNCGGTTTSPEIQVDARSAPE